jgi:hypothetical protein
VEHERVERQRKAGAPSAPRRVVASPSPQRVVLRRALSVGRADDPLEREADEIAALVTRAIEHPDGATVNRMPATTRIRRSSTSDRLGGAEVDADTAREIESHRGRGAPLEPRIARRVGDALGADLGGVRVHADEASDRLARSLDARAFTVGRDVFVRSDERAAVRDERSPLLAHELAHVVQQGGA